MSEVCGVELIWEVFGMKAQEGLREEEVEKGRSLMINKEERCGDLRQ